MSAQLLTYRIQNEKKKPSGIINPLALPGVNCRILDIGGREGGHSSCNYQNPNSAKYNLNSRWVLYENDFAHPNPPHRNSTPDLKR